ALLGTLVLSTRPVARAGPVRVPHASRGRVPAVGGARTPHRGSAGVTPGLRASRPRAGAGGEALTELRRRAAKHARKRLHGNTSPTELVPTQRFNLKRDGSLTKMEEP